VAIDVLAEAGATAGHAERAALAVSVLLNPARYGEMMLRGVLINPNCNTGTSDPLADDGAMKFVLSSLWNAYAGYSPVTA